MTPSCNAFVDNLYTLDCLLRRGAGVTEGAVVQRIAARVGPPEWYALAFLMLLIIGLLGVVVIARER